MPSFDRLSRFDPKPEWPTPAQPASAAAILWLARFGKHEQIPHPKGV